MTGQSGARWGHSNRDRGEKKVESERLHVAAEGGRCQPPARTLPVNHEPRGKI